MLLKVTLIYAGTLGLSYLLLTLNVVRLRWKEKIGIGHAPDPKSPLFRAVRIHGNFFEFVPFILLLMAMDEITGRTTTCLHTMGIGLVLSRGLHFFGISKTHGVSWQRSVGVVITLIILITLSINLLLKGIA